MTMYAKTAYIGGLLEVLTFRQINSKRNRKAPANYSQRFFITSVKISSKE